MNFKNSKCDYIIYGDININLLMSNYNKSIATYVQILESNGCHLLLTEQQDTLCVANPHYQTILVSSK